MNGRCKDCSVPERLEKLQVLRLMRLACKEKPGIQTTSKESRALSDSEDHAAYKIDPAARSETNSEAFWE